MRWPWKRKAPAPEPGGSEIAPEIARIAAVLEKGLEVHDVGDQVEEYHGRRDLLEKVLKKGRGHWIEPFGGIKVFINKYIPDDVLGYMVCRGGKIIIHYRDGQTVEVGGREYKSRGRGLAPDASNNPIETTGPPYFDRIAPGAWKIPGDWRVASSRVPGPEGEREEGEAKDKG